jgi:hypothetical protein
MPEAAQQVHKALIQRVLPAQQLGINLGEFLQLLLQLAVMSHALLGLLLLVLTFEKEFGDFAGRQTLSEIVEGAMFATPMATATVLFTADRVTLDERGAQEVRIDFELREQVILALAQRQSGFTSATEYPSHI